jgi:hypothetical protein
LKNRQKSREKQGKAGITAGKGTMGVLLHARIQDPAHGFGNDHCLMLESGAAGEVRFVNQSFASQLDKPRREGANCASGSPMQQSHNLAPRHIKQTSHRYRREV